MIVSCSNTYGPGGTDHVPAPELSSVSAVVQTFSTANYISRTGITDLLPGTTLVLCGLKSSNSGNQTLWGCCHSTAGWHITISGGAGGRIDIYFRGGSNPSYPLNGGGAAPNSYFWIALTRTVGGALRVSMNGLAVAQASAAPAYVANDGTSVETFGRVNPAFNTFALATGGIVTAAVLSRAATDAELIAWAGQISATDRFAAHPNVRADASLVYEMHFARDWDGSAATLTAGLGSSPPTFNRIGTGGTRTVIPAYRRIRFTDHSDLTNCDLFDRTILPAGAAQANHFASTRIQTSATHLIYDIDTVNNGSVNDADRIGIEVDAVQDAAAQQLWGFDASQTIDRMGLSASSKTVEAINNYHEFSGSHYKGGIGNTITGFRYPVASAMTILRPRISARLLIVGNSMTGKVVGGGGTLIGSAYQCYVVLARRNVRTSSVPAWANGDVIGDGWGGRSWHDVAETSDTRTEWAERHVAALDGAAKNVVYWCLDINDYIRNPWGGDTAAFGVALGQYLDLFKALADAAAIPNLTCYLGTSQPKTDESAVGGHIAQDYRDVVTTAGASRSWLTVVQGPTMTTTAELGDALHFHAAGHVVMEAALRAVVGY